MALAGTAPGEVGRRLCAESCLELLLMEWVAQCQRARPGPPPQAALEAGGFRVGRQLAERYTRVSSLRLQEPLDLIKFICKEFWNQVFRKTVDNLKTNHRGTFVLVDRDFRWLRRLAPDQGGEARAQALARLYLAFPCGLIRGALRQLGMACEVQAQTDNLQQATFTIVVQQQQPPGLTAAPKTG